MTPRALAYKDRDDQLPASAAGGALTSAAIGVAAQVSATAEACARPSDLLGWRSWVGQSAWAITDRALFSLSNFAINLVLARWLSPHGYGAFTLAYAIFLLLGAGHTSFLSDPMLVFGAGAYQDRWPAYIRVLLRAHWAFSGAATLVLLITAVVIRLAGNSPLADALTALALATPFILLQWLLRLACYVRMEPHRAAYAGASYMLLVLCGIYVLDHQGWLSPATSLGLMGVASMASIIAIYRGLPKPGPAGREPELFHDVVARHWNYTRWIIGGNALAWIPQSTCYLLLPVHGGLPEAAALKALINLVMPLLQTYWALAGILVPALVRARGRASFRQIVLVVLCLWSGGALLYWLLLGSFNRPVIHYLYNGRYDSDAGLLWIAGMIPLLCAGELMLNSVLRSREQPEQIFWASVLSSLCALSLGLILIFTSGVRGAVLALLCASITNIVAMAWQCRNRDAAGEPAFAHPSRILS